MVRLRGPWCKPAQSPNYDTYAYMATLFGGEAWELCYELGQTKSDTQLSTQVPQIFVHKKIKIQL